MTKKKIGELEGTPIVTGDKNYANEHEYYMTLNSDNTYQKLEQRTNGDQFRLVLGGGSGSGSGCDCGSFKYNELPEPAQFRDPTQEELDRYRDHSSLYKVLDLKNGIVPDKLILLDSSDSNNGAGIFNLFGYYKEIENGEIFVNYYTVVSAFNGTHTILLNDIFKGSSTDLVIIHVSSDGSLMLVDKNSTSVG